jgi:phosphopantothenoylcysteine decarboxylase/phosphopantothenate--cysteine ligase
MAVGSLRILITAGPTREYIDPVRFISNDSSGRMGVALSEAAIRSGHRVTLIHGPLAVGAPRCSRAARGRCVTRPATSAVEMLDACRRVWPRHDVLIMAAAVADYRPARVRKAKMKKSRKAVRLVFKPNVDVVAALAAERRTDQLVVGFALEDRNARRRAEKKLREKRLDAIVLNRPEAVGAERASVEVLVRGQRWRGLRRAAKPEIARQIIGIVERLWRECAVSVR